jgi:HD superfamily phosphohydrolase
MTDFAATGFAQTGTIRDQLYDRIPVAREELALIGSLPFQRLERIQQLGFASRIWPGARHTRFEHSLGVLYLARRALDHLLRHSSRDVVPQDAARVLVAAALLHDIGHYPFSHAIEELGDPIAPHEVVGREIVLQEPVAGILRETWEVDPERVAAIIDPHGYEMPAVDRLLRGLLSGPLDVDKMDYLPRDARACGVPYGGVDTERLLDALTVTTIDGEERIVIGAKGISPTHSLINARQEMFDNVYWHHTNRACMAMLLRAVQEAVLAGAITPGRLTNLDDAQLLRLLNGSDMPETTRVLCTALQTRAIHKRAIEFSSRAGQSYSDLSDLWTNPARRRAVEDAIAGRIAGETHAAVRPGDVLIDIPKPEKWRTDLWVVFTDPPVGFEPLMPWHEVAGLGAVEMKRYEEHRRLVRIVCAAPLRDVPRACWLAAVEFALDRA